MKQYYVCVWEQWEHGNKWCYLVGTNDIEGLTRGLKAQYDRFTIEER